MGMQLSPSIPGASADMRATREFMFMLMSCSATLEKWVRNTELKSGLMSLLASITAPTPTLQLPVFILAPPDCLSSAGSGAMAEPALWHHYRASTWYSVQIAPAFTLRNLRPQ